jgi:uncharacterized protein YajQ (UPF0234 family)
MDVVSKIDRQEVDNALNQAAKEVAQRYDFKGTDASVAWSGEGIVMKASSEERGQGRPRRAADQARAPWRLAQGP